MDIGAIIGKLCEYRGEGIGNSGIKRYYVDTAGRNKKAMAEYIQNQLQEDKINDQLTIKEYYDPFTGEPVSKSK